MLLINLNHSIVANFISFINLFFFLFLEKWKTTYQSDLKSKWALDRIRASKLLFHAVSFWPSMKIDKTFPAWVFHVNILNGVWLLIKVYGDREKAKERKREERQVNTSHVINSFSIDTIIKIKHRKPLADHTITSTINLKFRFVRWILKWQFIICAA